MKATIYPTISPKFTEDDVLRSICRASFYDFFLEMWNTIETDILIPNWHIQYLCNLVQRHAERVFRGQERLCDLIANVPPGTTKSRIFSIFLPAWIWTKMPSACFLGVSYAHTLSMELSRKTRDLVTSEKYQRLFPEIELREDQNTKHFFANTKGGMRYSAGVDGTVTGFHFHFIVIDDPLNPEQAASDLDLKTANRWITSTLSTRKKDKRVTLTVLVMQRLHQDDPTQQFLNRGKVFHAKLPAEIWDGPKPESLKRFYRQGLLDPHRLPKSVLAEEKKKGENYYSSQFRQDPVPPGGAMFKVVRLKRGNVPTKWKRLVRYWDKAGTNRGGAYSVGTLMGLDMDGRFWVLDVIRVQMDSFEREHLIRKTAERDGYDVIIGTEQEPGSGGKGSAQDSARRLRGFRVRIIKVDASTGGKEQRAEPFSVQVNAGNVYLPDTLWEGTDRHGQWIGWAAAWVDEFKYFPFSRYKDQVDSGSGAFNECNAPVVEVGAMFSEKEEGQFNQDGIIPMLEAKPARRQLSHKHW